MRINEILGFATRSPKKTTITKKVRKDLDDEPIAIKLQKRRAAAAKGDKNAFTHDFKKANN
jgi:hypothetical protein